MAGGVWANQQEQIQTYLEHHGGPGVQHLALLTDDIFETMAELRKRAYVGGREEGALLQASSFIRCRSGRQPSLPPSLPGSFIHSLVLSFASYLVMLVAGFEFMPRASEDYYRKLPEKMGGSLSEEQLRRVEELGLLADKDDQGVLLQVGEGGARLPTNQAKGC